MYMSVPQGSIYDWTACRLVGFVDDVTMLVTPIMLEALLTAVTEAIGRIEAWLLSRGFYLAREKTETTFRNTKGVPRSFSFQYEEHEIVVVKSLRCLGIIFDRSEEALPPTHAQGHRKTIRLASAFVGLMANLTGLKQAVRRIYQVVV